MTILKKKGVSVAFIELRTDSNGKEQWNLTQKFDAEKFTLLQIIDIIQKQLKNE